MGGMIQNWSFLISILSLVFSFVLFLPLLSCQVATISEYLLIIKRYFLGPNSNHKSKTYNRWTKSNKQGTKTHYLNNILDHQERLKVREIQKKRNYNKTGKQVI
jgi:hypothetical protein